MKKALIELVSSRLCDIVPAGSEFPVAPGLQWVDVPDDTTPATHEWNGTAVVAKPAKTLVELKADKWAMIKRARTQAEQAPFTWDGSTFDGDRESQARIQGAVLMALLAIQAGQPFAIDWTLADDSVRTLSASDMLAVGQALAARVNVTHQTGRVKREAIAGATDLPAVAAVSWD